MRDEESYIGKQIGNYILVAKIACGTFGCVYQAKHAILTNRIVAIKLMHTAHLDSAQEYESFVQEALLLEKLKHSYILSIIDVGIHEGFPHLVTEYASGGSLHTRLNHQSSKPLAVEEATTILSQIGQALHYAHQQNIVHRDLKPANILFNAKGEALLADFGIATVLATARTRPVDNSGTPSYMAPEHFEGTISMKSDQYALGCIAYELMTGQQPFTAPDFFSLWFKQAKENPIAPRQLNPQLPTHIEQAILKALAKQRTDRYADIAAFIQSLHAFIQSEADLPIVLTSETSTIRPSQESMILAPPPPALPQTSAPRIPQKTKEQWMDEGETHYKHWHSREALAAYEQAIRLAPTFADAYRGKGDALSQLGRSQEALAAYEQAIRLAPTFADAYKGKGDALSTLERSQEAFEAYEQAIRLDPNLADAYLSKASLLFALNNFKATDAATEEWKKALEASERAIWLHPGSASAYYSKGQVLLLLDRKQEALVAFEQAIHLDPDLADAYGGKARALSALDRHEEKLATYEQVIRLDPNNALAYRLKGDALLHNSG